MKQVRTPSRAHGGISRLALAFEADSARNGVENAGFKVVELVDNHGRKDLFCSPGCNDAVPLHAEHIIAHLARKRKLHSSAVA